MPADAVRSSQPGGLRGLGRALAHRNYRLFFAGQGLSLIGTWMTYLATSWLVFRCAPGAGAAAFLLGVNGFAGQVPTFFLAPVAGALVDRWDHRRTLLATQALALVQSALLALVAFSAQPGEITVIWKVIGLSFFQGLINAFDMPARQAFVVEMVENRADLPNAIALNSSLVNGARLLGPALAGLLIAVTSEGWCFVIDAISYLAVLAALLAMRLTPRPLDGHHPLWRAAAEGMRYAFGFAPIRSILLLLAVVSFMGFPYRVLLPLFAANILHGSSSTLGFLTGAGGVGALVGALYLASRRTVLGFGSLIVVATVLFGLGLIGLGLSSVFWLSLLLMLPIGGGMMVGMAASNTVLQTIVEEDKRGRVMSLYNMAIQGTTPFGSLLLGYLAQILGAPGAVLIGGGVCLVGAALFALVLPRLRAHARPLYIRLGLLPEVAGGVQAATEMTRSEEG